LSLRCDGSRIFVTAPDFELGWDLYYNGGLVRWYDLANDPERRENLCMTSENGSYSQGSVYDYSTYKFSDGREYMHTLNNDDPSDVTLEVLEASPARVRIRQVGHVIDNTGSNAKWTDVTTTTDYTVYPTGRMAVDARADYLPGAEDLRLENYSIHMDGLYWTGFSDDLDDYGQTCEMLTGQTFVGVAGNSPDHRHQAGALLVHYGDFPHNFEGICFDTTTWEDLGFIQWILAEGEYHPETQKYRYAPQNRHENFAVQLSAPGADILPEPIASRQAAHAWAADYREPPAIQVNRGSANGFDPAEACYAVGWSPNGVEVEIPAAVRQPCLRIEGYTGGSLPEIQCPLPFNASLQAGSQTLLLQILSVPDSAVLVVIQ